MPRPWARQSGAAKKRHCTALVSNMTFSFQGRVMPLAFSDRLRYQSHMSDDSIEGLAKKLAESVPEGLRAMRDDLETNFRGVLQTGISKLDLVTREEFEVQEAVLARTREKLERLEARLEEIEKA
jgi:BMFP domain-containing protein YqiC